MAERLRHLGRPRVLLLLGSGALAALASTAGVQADDRVYKYRNAEGREVFTNAGRVAIGGEPLAPIALPALDLGRATPAQLQQLDREVTRAHEAVQNGERCEAIRASLRASTSRLLLREHLRELLAALLLVGAALVVFAAWGGRLRVLMPIAPLLGALYLGYATYGRMEHRRSALRDGLRACSSDLPPPGGASAERVKTRLERALSLQAAVDRAYAQRDEHAGRTLRDR